VLEQQGEEEIGGKKDEEGMCEEDSEDMGRDLVVGEGAQEADRIVGKVRKDPGQPSAEGGEAKCHPPPL